MLAHERSFAFRFIIGAGNSKVSMDSLSQLKRFVASYVTIS
jgi:hypothetical protein